MAADQNQCGTSQQCLGTENDTRFRCVLMAMHAVQVPHVVVVRTKSGRMALSTDRGRQAGAMLSETHPPNLALNYLHKGPILNHPEGPCSLHNEAHVAFDGPN